MCCFYKGTEHCTKIKLGNYADNQLSRPSNLSTPPIQRRIWRLTCNKQNFFGFNQHPSFKAFPDPPRRLGSPRDQVQSWVPTPQQYTYHSCGNFSRENLSTFSNILKSSTRVANFASGHSTAPYFPIKMALRAQGYTTRLGPRLKLGRLQCLQIAWRRFGCLASSPCSQLEDSLSGIPLARRPVGGKYCYSSIDSSLDIMKF